MRIVIEFSGRGRKVMTAIILVVALTIPSSVFASHLFGDVPNSNLFHDDISAIALAGITVGCGGGNFCPGATLTRGQEAAFIHRASGRVAGDYGFANVPPQTEVVVASLTIETGLPPTAIGGANGFLKIDGAVALEESQADECECHVLVRVRVDGVAHPFDTVVFLDNDTGREWESGALSVVVPVTSGPKTVQLTVFEGFGTAQLEAEASLTALYVPFGSTGTDTSAADVSTDGSPTPPGN